MFHHLTQLLFPEFPAGEVVTLRKHTFHAEASNSFQCDAGFSALSDRRKANQSAFHSTILTLQLHLGLNNLQRFDAVFRQGLRIGQIAKNDR